MKKMFLPFLCATIFTTSLAQKKVPITLDFKNNFPTELKQKVKYKDTVVIIVNNINRKVYKVESTNTKTDFNITPPEALKSLKLPGFINLSLPAAADLGMSSLPGLTNLPITEYNSKIEELLFDINRRGKKLDSGVLFYNSLNKLFKDCNGTASEIQNGLNTKIFSYLGLSRAVGDYTTPALLVHLSDTLFAMYPAAKASLDTLQQLVPEYLTKKKNEQKKSLKTLEDKKLRYEAIIKSRTATKKQKDSAKDDLEQVKQQIENAKKFIELFVEQEAALKDQIKEAKDLVDAMREFEKDDKINTITSLAAVMSRPENFQFTSEKLVAKKDEIKYTISVSADELNACGMPDKKTSEITIKTKGGLKVDFSTGVFLLGGSDKFLGETYYWDNIDGTTRQIVTAERGNRLQLGIGALAHFYMRSYSSPKAALSIGVSTTSGFDDLNFHIGPSVIFGNKDRLIISGGLALKSTKVLDQQLKINTPYPKDDSPDDIPTVPQFPVAGFFFSLTYNLSRFKGE